MEICTLSIHAVNEQDETEEFSVEVSRTKAIQLMELFRDKLQLSGYRYYPNFDCWQRIQADGTSSVVRMETTND